MTTLDVGKGYFPTLHNIPKYTVPQLQAIINISDYKFELFYFFAFCWSFLYELKSVLQEFPLQLPTESGFKIHQKYYFLLKQGTLILPQHTHCMTHSKSLFRVSINSGTCWSYHHKAAFANSINSAPWAISNSCRGSVSSASKFLTNAQPLSCFPFTQYEDPLVNSIRCKVSRGQFYRSVHSWLE